MNGMAPMANGYAHVRNMAAPLKTLIFV